MTQSKGCCEALRKCRMAWYGKTICFFLIVGYVFALFSVVDCIFVFIDVGFVPLNGGFRDNHVGVGLWSYEDTGNFGKCVIPAISNNADNDNSKGLIQSYINKAFMNGDAMWNTCRYMSICGLLFHLVAMVLLLLLICSPPSKTTSRKKEFIFFLMTLAFLCEGVKLGLMFDIDICTKPLWEAQEAAEIILFEAEECDFGRGSYFSLASILCSFITMILIIGNIILPPYTHERSQNFDYDDVTLPSFLGSIGESVGQYSKASSALSSIFSKTSKQSQDSSSSGRQNRIKPVPSSKQLVKLNSDKNKSRSRREVFLNTIEEEGEDSLRKSLRKSLSSRSSHTEY